MVGHPCSHLASCLWKQDFALRTNTAVPLRLIEKCARWKPAPLPGGSAAHFRVAWPPENRPLVQPSSRYSLAWCIRCQHHLLRLFSNRCSTRSTAGSQLGHVVGLLCHGHSHNQPMRCIGGNLRVVAERESLSDASSPGLAGSLVLTRAASHAQLLRSCALATSATLPAHSPAALVARRARAWACLAFGLLWSFRGSPISLTVVAPAPDARESSPPGDNFCHSPVPLSSSRQHITCSSVISPSCWRRRHPVVHPAPAAFPSEIRQRVVVHFPQTIKPLELWIVLTPSCHFPCRA